MVKASFLSHQNISTSKPNMALQFLKLLGKIETTERLLAAEAAAKIQPRQVPPLNQELHATSEQVLPSGYVR